MPSFVFPSQAHVIPESACPHISAIGFERWQEVAADRAETDLALAHCMSAATDTPVVRRLLAAIFGGSPFLSHAAHKEPDTVCYVLQHGPTVAFSQACEDVHAACYDETDRNRIMRELRVFKRRAALIIAMADIAQDQPLETIVHMISITAETAAQLAVRHLIRPHCTQDHSNPEEKCGYFILAMGKLGAQELNYSSDVDLIALYDPDKAQAIGIDDPRKVFIQATRDLVNIFDTRTADGYVFRTDLRLRPDPGSTPVAMSVLAAESYYESYGQNWERAAMIKARPIAGDIDAGNEFLKMLRPFVWRKSLDYNAIQDIHSIKRQINSVRGGKTMNVPGHNVKLGRGGIREIEFFAQTQQLIWGGREPLLRNNQTLKILDILCRGGFITESVRKDMHDSYVYLRHVEHRLQMIDDAQTQTLPTDSDKLRHLAVFLGYEDEEEFSEDLLQHLRRVEGHYTALFPEGAVLGTEDGNLVFTGTEDDPDTLETLQGLGFQQPGFICQTVRGWHVGRYRATRSDRARQLLTELVPMMLKSLGRSANPDEAFKQFDGFLSRLPAGIQLFAMFQAHPKVMGELMELLGDSPKLAQTLSQNPSLLDNLLSPEFFQPLPPISELVVELALRFEQSVGFEDSLNIARRFVKDRIFQIGVQTLRGLMDAKEAGQSFAILAEAVLQALLPEVTAEYAETHGNLPDGKLVVLALGRLGSADMTPTSDLDLILIYDAPFDAESDGRRPLGTTTYYARLVQRIMNALTAPTAEGTLYEVDMRLRPSGNAGPLAVSFESFEKYQKGEAWTWEHQALTRARVVAGDAQLAQRVQSVVQDVLSMPRDSGKIAMDVSDMRARIRKSHAGQSPWEVKHRPGGLIDLDFIEQYLKLCFADRHPEILDEAHGDAVTFAGQCGILTDADVEAVQNARVLMRSVQMLLRLTMTEGAAEGTLPKTVQEKLCRVVGMVDFESLKAHMDTVAGAAHAVFDRLIEGRAQAARNAIEQQQAESES